MSRHAEKVNIPASYADKTIQILFYLLFFFTPLILWPFTSEVFEFNKMLFVYISTTLIAAAWAFKWLAEGKITIRRTPLDPFLALFFLSQLISTILSIDRQTSFWGYYSRFHGGLASTIAYLTLYYALVTNFSDPEKPNHSETVVNPKIVYLIYSALASGLLVAIYAVLEHFGIDQSLWVQDVKSRVFSTLGQPNWLSAYLVALLPLPIYLTFGAKKTLSRWFFAATSLLFFVSILFTKSRSGIGVTFVVLALILTHQIFRQNQTRRYFLAFTCLLTILALLIGTPWTPNPAQLKETSIKGGPYWPWAEKYLKPLGLSSQLKPYQAEKLTEEDKKVLEAQRTGVRYGGSDSFAIRNVVWQGAVELGKRKPLFGYGLETFGYTYYNVRPIAHNLLSEWDFLYNKAHNEYLNFLANAGFVGLGVYLLLIAAFLFFMIRTHIPHTGFSLKAALITGYGSTLITNYFGFSVVMVALFFFLFPALLFSISKDKPRYLSINLSINKSLLALIVILAAGYALITPVNQFRADLAYNRGKLLAKAERLKDALPLLTKARDLNPGEPTFYAQLAETQAQAVMAIKQQLDALPATVSATYKEQGQQLLDGYFQDAIANAQKAINLNKYHTTLYKSKAKVELYLGTVKPEYNQKALNTLLELTALAPTDAKVYYNIGLLYDQLEQVANAQLAYKRAIELKPDYEEPKRFLFAN